MKGDASFVTVVVVVVVVVVVTPSKETVDFVTVSGTVEAIDAFDADAVSGVVVMVLSIKI